MTIRAERTSSRPRLHSHVRATAIDAANGTVQRWAVISIDISERNPAEKSLALTRNRQRADKLQTGRYWLPATPDSPGSDSGRG